MKQVGEPHALLAGAGIDAPYVLVDHSYGGRIARVYAKEYPSEIVGMVLIDPGTLDDDPRFPPEKQPELASEKRTITLARWLAPFGLVRCCCCTSTTMTCRPSRRRIYGYFRGHDEILSSHP